MALMGQTINNDDLYKSLFSNNHVCMLIVDPVSKKIVDANPASCKFYGYDYNTIIDMPISGISISTPNEIDQIIQDALSEKQNNFVVKHKLSDGELRDVELYIAPIQCKGQSLFYSIIYDITERKKTESAILKNQILLRDSQRVAHIGCWELDIETLVLTWNEEAYAIYGYTNLEIHPNLEIFTRLVHPDDRWIPFRHFEKMLRTKKFEDFECRIVRLDGTVRTILIAGAVSISDQGEPYRTFGIVQDITERKQVEEKLKKSEARLRTLIDTIPDLIWLKDPEGIFLQCNHRFEKYFGAAENEIVGKTDFDFVDEKLATFFRRNDLAAMAAGKPTVNEELITFPDGHSEVLETIKTPIFESDGKLIGVLGIGRDITKHKQAEKELRESRRFLATLISNLPGMVYRCKNDTDWTMEFVSEGSLATTGYTPEQLLGPFAIAYNNVIHPEDQKMVWDIVQTGVRAKQPFRMEYRIISKNSTEKWVYEQGRGVFSESGDLLGLEGFITDITERKQNELLIKEKTEEIEAQNEEYQQINDELVQTNQKLQIAKEKAEESDQLKTAFIQNLSHEIRTPLNAIMGFAGLLTDYFSDKEKLEEIASIIIQRGTDLLEIIDEILDIARLETGQVLVNSKKCELNSLFSEIETIFYEYQYRKKKQHIKLYINNNLNIPDNTVIIDQLKLKQILTNLITNALKFTHTGVIEVGYNIYDNDSLMFYVADTGIGIPKDKHSAIFGRFTQVDPSTTRIYGGTGLGLSIVQGLLDLLGGKIWLESKPGKGSTFYFIIPYKKTEPTNPFDQR
jgi:PAS domain S-box-containing protein